MAINKKEWRARQAETAETLEDAVSYCHAPRRKVSLNMLITQTQKAEVNAERWNERLEACRAELTDRRQEIIYRIDGLNGILSTIDRYTDSRLS